MGTLYLDPNAASYTDDEIVGKVNAASAQISRADAIAGTALGGCDADDLAEGSANKWAAESGATCDQTGDEMVAAIDAGTASITREGALSQDDLKLVKSDPASGQRQVRKLNLGADNKVEVDFNDTPEP